MQGSGSDEIVVCAWDGMTYIVDQQRNSVRFQFEQNVSAFTAGTMYNIIQREREGKGARERGGERGQGERVGEGEGARETEGGGEGGIERPLNVESQLIIFEIDR